MSMFPSLMRSFINLLVRSSSISWHCSRSLNSGLSRKESLNSSVGRPIDNLIQHTDTWMDQYSKTRLLCPWWWVLREKTVFHRARRKLVRGSFQLFFSCRSHFSPTELPDTGEQQRSLWQTQFVPRRTSSSTLLPDRFKAEILQHNWNEQISRLIKYRPWLKESSLSSVFGPDEDCGAKSGCRRLWLKACYYGNRETPAGAFKNQSPPPPKKNPVIKHNNKYGLDSKTCE